MRHKKNAPEKIQRDFHTPPVSFSKRDKKREMLEEAVKRVLFSTNGEFSSDERKIFELYFFQDKEDDEIMKECGISPNKFWDLIDSCSRKMRKYEKNFRF